MCFRDVYLRMKTIHCNQKFTVTPIHADQSHFQSNSCKKYFTVIISVPTSVRLQPRGKLLKSYSLKASDLMEISVMFHLSINFDSAQTTKTDFNCEIL